MPLISKLSEEPAWFCLRSQPKKERVAQRTLLTLPGVEVFLPLARFHRKLIGGKERRINEPIFPCYLFCRFVPAELTRQVQYTNGVSYIIRRGDELVELAPEFIDELRTVAPDGFLELAPKPLYAGEKIRLVQGIFAGSNAEVVELAPAADRVKVLLEFLGREQEITIPVDAVERNFDNPLRES